MIRAQSKARQKQIRKYFKLRITYLLSHPFCETHAKIFGDLSHPKKSVDIHHTRGRTGSLLVAVEWWKAVCRNCHEWIGLYPDAARNYGLIAPLGQWNQTEKLRQQKERNAAS